MEYPSKLAFVLIFTAVAFVVGCVLADRIQKKDRLRGATKRAQPDQPESESNHTARSNVIALSPSRAANYV